MSEAIAGSRARHTGALRRLVESPRFQRLITGLIIVNAIMLSLETSDAVMEAYPWAWAFFVPFIIVTAFAVLNLFVAIIVNAMSAEAVAETTASAHADNERILEEIAALRVQIADLSATLADAGDRARINRGA